MSLTWWYIRLGWMQPVKKMCSELWLLSALLPSTFFGRIISRISIFIHCCGFVGLDNLVSVLAQVWFKLSSSASPRLKATASVRSTHHVLQLWAADQGGTEWSSVHGLHWPPFLGECPCTPSCGGKEPRRPISPAERAGGEPPAGGSPPPCPRCDAAFAQMRNGAEWKWFA